MVQYTYPGEKKNIPTDVEFKQYKDAAAKFGKKGYKIATKTGKAVQFAVDLTGDVPVSRRNVQFIQRGPQNVMSPAQQMINEMFSGSRTWGTGQNLPELNEALTSGSGIIKSQDYSQETAGLFGLNLFKRRRRGF